MCETFVPLTLTAVREGKADRPVRLLCDGVFDLTHYGHYLLFRNAKLAVAPHPAEVVAATVSDDEILRFKRPPVLSMEQRCLALSLSADVDEVRSDLPYVPTLEYMDQHRIDLLVHNSTPYRFGGCPDIYRPMKDADRFLTVERTDGVSTSYLIGKISGDRAEKVEPGDV